MELSQIKSAMAVVEMGSFAKAAKALFLSPQTIKNQIDALESELGCTLFERTSQGARVTERGELFFEEGKKVVKAAAALVATLRESFESNQIRIACPRNSSQPLRDRLCMDFELSHPEVGFKHVVCEEGQMVLDCVLEGKADIAFSVALDDDAMGALRFREFTGIPEMGFVAAMAKWNPLSQRGVLTPSDLAPVGAVFVRKDIVPQNGPLAGLAVERDFSDQYEVVDYCLRGGVCVTNSYFPIDHAGLVSIPIDVPRLKMFVVTLPQSSSEVAAFVDFCLHWKALDDGAIDS